MTRRFSILIKHVRTTMDDKLQENATNESDCGVLDSSNQFLSQNQDKNIFLNIRFF